MDSREMTMAELHGIVAGGAAPAGKFSLRNAFRPSVRLTPRVGVLGYVVDRIRDRPASTESPRVCKNGVCT